MYFFPVFSLLTTKKSCPVTPLWPEMKICSILLYLWLNKSLIWWYSSFSFGFFFDLFFYGFLAFDQFLKLLLYPRMEITFCYISSTTYIFFNFFFTFTLLSIWNLVMRILWGRHLFFPQILLNCNMLFFTHLKSQLFQILNSRTCFWTLDCIPMSSLFLYWNHIVLIIVVLQYVWLSSRVSPRLTFSKKVTSLWNWFDDWWVLLRAWGG